MAVKAKLWHVYLAENCFHTDPPKDKFVVVSHIEKNDYFGFLINSKITAWLSRRQNLLVCEAVITVKDHVFLNYDSYVDCQEIFRFYDWDFAKQVGVISPDVKTSIVRAVSACPTIERKYKTAILTREGHLLNDTDNQ